MKDKQKNETKNNELINKIRKKKKEKKRKEEIQTWVVETHDVVLERRSTSGDHDLEVQVLSQLLAHLRRLEGKLSRGNQNHG